MLSRKAKESIKTALAMTIAYGIALWMNWDRPYWAGFAVAFVSLATIGQSLNKAALRMFATLFAAAVALVLIAFFAQDRWLFISVVSVYTGICCYLMGGRKYQYFWQASAFICIIICLDAGPDPAVAFDTAVLRAEQTGLGIFVYTAVSLLLWPVNSRADFDAVARALASTQHALFQASLAMMKGKGKPEEVQQLRAQALQQQTRFSQLLDAAEADNYEIRELRSQWRRYRREVLALTEAMERWRESLADTASVNLRSLVPDLDPFGAELERRLAQNAPMLAGEVPARPPQTVDLPIDRNGLRGLSHFQRAAIAVIRSNLLSLDTLSRSAFEALSEIRGGGASDAPDEKLVTPGLFFPDPDRVAQTIRFVVVLWAAFLAVIYVGDLPGGTGYAVMAASIGIALATMPQIPVSMLYAPAAGGIAFAGVLYIFLMPRLSSFLGLGAMIFAGTFAICYLFAEPRQMLGRALGLAMFVTVASVSNQQTYSFISVATTSIMFALLFPLLAVTVHFPISWRPERVFLRLLGRYFRSCEYLTSTLSVDAGRPVGRRERWRRVFHRGEISTLPGKLASWVPHIDVAALRGTSMQQVQALVTGLHELTSHVQSVLEEGTKPQDPKLVQGLLSDVREWRVAVQQVFNGLSADPTAGEPAIFRARAGEITSHLEGRIEEVLNQGGEGPLQARHAENFYRLLGAYRGVTEALVVYAQRTGGIDWVRWREERF